MSDAIADTGAAVLLFPVRHHSPACARLVAQLARELRPAAVLIEGPSDFNDRIDELALPHQLPIAVYSWLRLPDGARRGAFYPFCSYSPEWAALQAARELGAPARFIDLPWPAIAAPDTPAHRYADGDLRRSGYVAALCLKLGVEDFDALWDTLFEIPELSPGEYLRRAHQLMAGIRAYEGSVQVEDIRREAYMAANIRAAQARYGGPLLVVTGGYHSPALFERLNGPPPGDEGSAAAEAYTEGGSALTPFSYARLDNLAGYEAGMPSPGFYHQVWLDRAAGRHDTFRTLLGQAATALRARKQPISAADLIAVETTARSLAELRGHGEVWRRDLVDAIRGALIKEPIAGGGHPVLSALFAEFRGHRRGRLAGGTQLPPLVEDIRSLLHEHRLEASSTPRTLELDLHDAHDLERSRVLHRLRGLGIPGYRLNGGTNLAQRDDLATIRERWELVWTPELEAACIEAAIYGASLADASRARLGERAAALERDAEAAALLLLDAGLMGFGDGLAELRARLVAAINGDGNFLTVAGALEHLLYLYRFDDALGTAGSAGIGALLAAAWQRGCWLLGGLGQAAEQDSARLSGIRALLQTLQRCGTQLELDRATLVDALERAGTGRARRPLLRGAAAGALWSLGEAHTAWVFEQLRLCADPAQLGDFLTGLFGLAREAVQREAELLASIAALLAEYEDAEFLHALPALRLAFSYFTPREKHYLAGSLLELLGVAPSTRLPELAVSPTLAGRALALEGAVFGMLKTFGLRGGRHG